MTGAGNLAPVVFVVRFFSACRKYNSNYSIDQPCYLGEIIFFTSKLTIMKLNLPVFLCLMLSTFVSFSQEIIWPTYTQVEIPDSVLNEKAIFLQNTLTMGFNNAGQTDVNYFKRILVLSDDGAEELRELEFYLSEISNLKRIGGRIIKEDGKIINLSETEKFKRYETVRDEYSDRVQRRYIVEFPNLEVGDVVDLMYDVKIDRYLLSNTLYIEGDYPSLYSRITLRNVSQFDLTAYAMNCAIQPKSKVENGTLTLHWERNGVKKMLDTYFHAPTPDQPCLIYSLWNRGTTLNYAEIFYYDNLSYPKEYPTFQSVTQSFADQGVYSMEDPMLIKLQKLIASFQKDYSFVENLSIEPTTKVRGHLMDKKINEEVFFIIVQKLLQENTVPFWVGYSQSLIRGPFYNGIVSLSQNDRRFLIVDIDEKEQHYLFGPEYGRFYFLDEVPYYLEGNQAVGMYGDKGTLEKLVSIELPQSTRQENTHFVKLLLKKEGSALTMRRDDHLSGHYSSITRGAGQSTWLQRFAIEQDSIDHSSQKTVYPYELDLSTTIVDHLEIIKSGDTVKSFTLKDVLERNIFDEDEETIEEMDNYLVLPFQKSIKYAVYYQSDVPITLVLPTDVKLNNAIGEITCKSSLVNEQVLSVTVSLVISDRFIQGDDEIAAYKALLDQWSSVRQLKYTFAEMK